MDAKELRQKRASMWEEAKSLHKLAEKEKRELTAEERTQWEGINKEIDQLKEWIEREERISAIDAELETVEEPQVAKRAAPMLANFQVNDPPHKIEDSPLPKKAEYKQAFSSYLRFGMNGMRPEQRAMVQPYFSMMQSESRAQGVGSEGAGGALVHDEFYSQVLDAMLQFGGMRQARTTKLQTSTGASMPIPTADDTGNKGAILTETSQVTEQDITFASKNLGAFMYTSKLIRVSLQLLQDSAFPIDTWLPTKLGQRLGRIQNDHFTTGAGTTEPFGIITSTTQGSLGANGSTTSVTYAKLVELEHSIDPAYRSNGAQWMFNDRSLRAIKELTDDYGRPLWLPGIAVNAPDTLLGYPYIINQSMAVMAANAKSILFGDFSYYFIRDVLDLRVLRLEERYADYLQVGFLAFMRSDGVFANPDGGSANSPVKYYQNSAT
jgi:HK97 family phage major capsid protein